MECIEVQRQVVLSALLTVSQESKDLIVDPALMRMLDHLMPARTLKVAENDDNNHDSFILP